MKLPIAILFTLLLSSPGFAKPVPLVIDSSAKPKSFERYINAVHKEIPVNGKSVGQIRYAIFEGMLKTKGFSWVYEGEGDGYILARFDYRGDTNVMRIEYDEDYVQLKYHAALGDYVCKNLIEDICYKNGRGYYNYIKNLRKSIHQQLKY
ncbi:hypothetical protein L2750_02450 [Shewanella submarina]|uniref:Uncharacterized protein n=1 Tax=Shewanella submarina TaxID=2016376 RepID=A0ABV7GFP0_9GAMM|nr:hypothetical protein [Shewanella submarina]MCL1036014.1 hypothetical protein [Shewanella submarina]